jgi:hypothetical protein
MHCGGGCEAAVRPRVREVNTDSWAYRLAREYMIRLRPEDLDDEAKLGPLAEAAGMRLDAFRCGYLILASYSSQADSAAVTRASRSRLWACWARMAVVYFFVVLPVNALTERFRAEEPVGPPQRECPHCLSKIPAAAGRCAFCIQEVPATPPTASVRW